MIDHNHPAVEALADAIYRELSGQYGDFGTPSKREAHSALSAALQLIGPDDLRDTTPAEPLARTILGVPDTHGAPHHDVEEIEPGDFVMQVDEVGGVFRGIAHHLDRRGYWVAEDGKIVAWPDYRADHPETVTVWPAPAPPAEVVDLPTEHPAHLLDVEHKNGGTFACMALDHDGYWVGVDQDGYLRACRPDMLAAFSLPDGTRVRRAGNHDDGTPRFVKEAHP